MPYAERSIEPEQSARPATGSPARRSRPERRQRRLAQPLGLLLDPRRRRGSRGRAAGPRRSRRTSGRARSRASGGSAKSSRRPPSSHAKRRSCSSAWPNGVAPSRTRDSIGVGDAEPAEHRLERRAPAVERRRDQRDLLGRRARRGSARSSSADELEGPARAGAFEEADGGIELRRAVRRLSEERALEMGERRRARSSGDRGGSSSIRPSASGARSSAVRASDANATRPGSYGSETCTSVRPASASRSDHSAPVRSSKPYAKTGSPCQASRSDSSRSAARRRKRSRSQSPSRSSSAR